MTKPKQPSRLADFELRLSELQTFVALQVRVNEYLVKQIQLLIEADKIENPDRIQIISPPKGLILPPNMNN